MCVCVWGGGCEVGVGLGGVKWGRGTLYVI